MGAIMTDQGFVENWQTLTLCRTLLGFFEGEFFPGCVDWINYWYRRKEMQKR
jgi:sugar phosphate permease